jgi:hypothetical protein
MLLGLALVIILAVLAAARPRKRRGRHAPGHPQDPLCPRGDQREEFERMKKDIQG